MTTWDGDEYQQRFDRLERRGQDVHGEADLVASLGPASVLDAGCGTGRVAIELARRGIVTVGVDPDRSMIATAADRAPDLRWIGASMCGLDLGERFDVVVMAGNVPLFTPAGTQADLVAGCALHVSRGGHLLCGFQLGRGYEVEEYDLHCAVAGLGLVDRWSTWDGDPFDVAAGYVVSVHTPTSDSTPGG